MCVNKDVEVINSLVESLEKLLSQDYQSVWMLYIITTIIIVIIIATATRVIAFLLQITLEEKRLGDVAIKFSHLYLTIKEVHSGKKGIFFLISYIYIC